MKDPEEIEEAATDYFVRAMAYCGFIVGGIIALLFLFAFIGLCVGVAVRVARWMLA